LPNYFDSFSSLGCFFEASFFSAFSADLGSSLSFNFFLFHEVYYTTEIIFLYQNYKPVPYHSWVQGIRILA
jgi:hypothetical protein